MMTHIGFTCPHCGGKLFDYIGEMYQETESGHEELLGNCWGCRKCEKSYLNRDESLIEYDPETFYPIEGGEGDN